MGFFAGEKKGHFRSRHYFDCYTWHKAAIFTQSLMNLKAKFKDFESYLKNRVGLS